MPEAVAPTVLTVFCIDDFGNDIQVIPREECRDESHDWFQVVCDADSWSRVALMTECAE